uniref:Signal peptidase complex subunit 1 n=1 Tax=Syphacia muris TaxID=451379 RepID=A0A0N5A8M6_9BILA
MDGFIQTLPASFRQFSTYIDFVGQRKAERIYQVVLILFAVVGFILGYVIQQLCIAIYTLGIGLLLSVILVIPPWPYLRQNPIRWQPTQTEKKHGKETKKTR